MNICMGVFQQTIRFRKYEWNICDEMFCSLNLYMIFPYLSWCLCWKQLVKIIKQILLFGLNWKEAGDRSYFEIYGLSFLCTSWVFYCHKRCSRFVVHAWNALICIKICRKSTYTENQNGIFMKWESTDCLENLFDGLFCKICFSLPNVRRKEKEKKSAWFIQIFGIHRLY